jgi:hypothetical protein
MLHNTAPSPSLNLKPIRDVVVNEMICPFTHLMDCMTLTKHSQAWMNQKANRQSTCKSAPEVQAPTHFCTLHLHVPKL